MSKKAFTVVELIAVIVVLAIILAITVPGITGIVRSSTMEAVESDAKLVLDAIRIKKIENNDFDPTTLTESNVDTLLGLSKENYSDLEVQINEGKTYIKLTGQGKWSGFSACGTFFDVQVNEGDCYLDFEPPTIVLLGDSSVTIQVGSTYSDAGATAADDIDGDITSKIIVTGTVNPNAVGIYVMSYDVSDNMGHPANTVTRTVNVIDTNNPVVTFGLNGNATYAKTRSTTVTVSDAGGINASSLKYQWTTNTTVPSEASFNEGFINGETISSPTGVTGSYYLWIIAKDNQNNTTILGTDVFNLDNTIPIITMNGSNNINVNKGSSYTDAGATATDAHSGLNGSVAATGTVNVNVVGTYTITYNVSDNAGNAAAPVTRTINVIDVSAPVITILGSNPVNINQGSVYSDAGATATDDVDGNVTSRINTTGTVNINIPGAYTITYTVSDNAGNNAVATRTVNVIDNVIPTVSFGTNGNATYAKTRSTTVTASDAGGLNASSLKYQWTTSTTAPSEASFSTGFTNGGTISGPAGVTGGYYLWILAKDNSNNTAIIRTNVFNLDNTAPIITMNGSSPIEVELNNSYTDAGATATDAHSGVTGSVTSTGSVNVNAVGTYTITYNVSDNAGNTAAAVVRTVYVVAKGVYAISSEYQQTSPGVYQQIAGLYKYIGGSPTLIKAGISDNISGVSDSVVYTISSEYQQTSPGVYQQIAGLYKYTNGSPTLIKAGITGNFSGASDSVVYAISSEYQQTSPGVYQQVAGLYKYTNGSPTLIKAGINGYISGVSDSVVYAISSEYQQTSPGVYQQIAGLYKYTSGSPTLIKAGVTSAISGVSDSLLYIISSEYQQTSPGVYQQIAGLYKYTNGSPTLIKAGITGNFSGASDSVVYAISSEYQQTSPGVYQQIAGLYKYTSGSPTLIKAGISGNISTW